MYCLVRPPVCPLHAHLHRRHRRLAPLPEQFALLSRLQSYEKLVDAALKFPETELNYAVHIDTIGGTRKKETTTKRGVTEGKKLSTINAAGNNSINLEKIFEMEIQDM